MSFTNKLGDDALRIIRNLPRLCLGNLRQNVGAKQRPGRKRGNYGGKTHGMGTGGGSKAKNSPMPLGYETGNNPFYKRFPYEPYNKDIDRRRQYPPLSLLQLQKFIDTNRVDPSKPIDLTVLCNSGLYTFDPTDGHFGVHLTHEGAERFKAKINIEVQWTSEPVIAAIERNGGIITTAFYDKKSLSVLKNPASFFAEGEPIPRRFQPPQDAILYYTGAENRGYLADPEAISWQRMLLAQKYGYILPKIEDDPQFKMLILKKDPRQVFFGLEPGWVVNLREKVILKPKDEELIEYYKS